MALLGRDTLLPSYPEPGVTDSGWGGQRPGHLHALLESQKVTDGQRACPGSAGPLPGPEMSHSIWVLARVRARRGECALRLGVGSWGQGAVSRGGCARQVCLLAPAPWSGKWPALTLAASGRDGNYETAGRVQALSTLLSSWHWAAGVGQSTFVYENVPPARFGPWAAAGQFLLWIVEKERYGG